MEQEEVADSATDNGSESQLIKVFQNISDRNIADSIVTISCANQQPQKYNIFVKCKPDFRQGMVNTNSVTLS